MSEETTEVTLLSKLKFWFILNWILISFVALYYFYQVTIEGKVAFLHIPKVYTEHDILLRALEDNYTLKVDKDKCYPVLKPTL